MVKWSFYALLTPKYRESHLHTFVGNQTTNICFWPILGGGRPKRTMSAFLPFFLFNGFPKRHRPLFDNISYEGSDTNRSWFLRRYRWFRFFARTAVWLEAKALPVTFDPGMGSQSTNFRLWESEHSVLLYPKGLTLIISELKVELPGE